MIIQLYYQIYLYIKFMKSILKLDLFKIIIIYIFPIKKLTLEAVIQT